MTNRSSSQPKQLRVCFGFSLSLLTVETTVKTRHFPLLKLRVSDQHTAPSMSDPNTYFNVHGDVGKEKIETSLMTVTLVN